MRTSDTLSKIIPAMVAAAGKLEDPKKGSDAEIKGKTKDGKPYTIKYSYTSLPDFLGAVRRLLAEHELVLIQSVDKSEQQIHTRILHASGEWVETTYPIPIVPDSQKMGIAHTYARRYSLIQTLGIAPTDDDDGAGTSGENAPKSMRPPVERREPPMEEPRKPQQSATGAPTKWSEQDRKRFCGALSGVGLRYDDVAGFCEAEGWGRPSGWGGRVPCDRFIADLGIGWNAAEKRWESKTTELRERLDSFLNAGG